MPSAEINPQVLAFLRNELAHFTETDPDSIPTDAVLVDTGLQSMDAVILSGKVEDTFGIELDPEIIFQHETLESFAIEVTSRLGG